MSIKGDSGSQHPAGSEAYRVEPAGFQEDGKTARSNEGEQAEENQPERSDSPLEPPGMRERGTSGTYSNFESIEMSDEEAASRLRQDPSLIDRSMTMKASVRSKRNKNSAVKTKESNTNRPVSMMTTRAFKNNDDIAFLRPASNERMIWRIIVLVAVILNIIFDPMMYAFFESGTRPPWIIYLVSA